LVGYDSGKEVESVFKPKKNRITYYDFIDVILRQSGFPLYGIRDFPSLPYDRFG